MKHKKIIAVALIALFVFSPISFSNIYVLSQTVPFEDITGYQEWNQSRTVDKGVTVEAGATLVINKGVEVNFTQKWIDVQVYGTLIIKGTATEPVVFKSDLDRDTFSIIANQNSIVSMTNASVINGGQSAQFVKNPINTALASGYAAALQIDGGAVDVTGTTFKNNNTSLAVKVSDASAVVHVNYSSFTDNAYDVEALSGNDFKYNWWARVEGPLQSCYIYGDNQQYCYYEKISGDFDFSDWLTSENLTIGASNVLFLPGIKASHLYKDGLAGMEDELWLPNYFGNDLAELALNKDGKSVNNVYTRDVLSDVGVPVIGSNIYKTFLGQLVNLKSQNTINDYESFAYDWRQSAEDIAQNGTPYEGAVKSVVADLQTLAGSSKSHRVTIVAHSNGGLVAKAAMIELAKLGLADKVDKIIFVGTPQMGTPLATLSMLYGYDESVLAGTLILRSDARSMIENMPGAYALLPSEKYFASLQNAFIDFSGQNHFADFKNAYGDTVDKFSEFRNFLLGTSDGRTKPAKSDVESANILNQKLLDEATALHQRLDDWVPPSNVQVTQIAGWGLDTVSGIKYAEKEKVNCFAVAGSKVPSCAGIGEYEPIYEPTFTVDGDKVVVAPSALMLSEAANAKRYWVNLNEYNNDTPNDVNHGSVLEATSIDNLIVSIIENIDTPTSLPKYIYTSRPDDYANAKPHLRMALYSPLNIHLRDTAGHHTGPREMTDGKGQKYMGFEENIPNSYYYQIGERKYVGFPAGEKISVEMDGYAAGSYTLKAEEVTPTADGEETGTQAVFTNLATTDGSKVAVDIPATGLADISTIKADLDKDGVVDYETPAEITVPKTDEIAPEAKIQFNAQTQKLEIVGVDSVSQNVTVVLADQPVIKKSNAHAKKIKAWFSEWSLRNKDKNYVTTVATLTDEAGNITNLVFVKTKDHKGYVSFGLKSIAYNGVESAFAKNLAQYKWQLNKKNQYTQTATHFDLENTRLESHYLLKKDQTWLMEKPKELGDDASDDNSELRPVKTKLPGMVIPGMITEQGKIKVIY